MRKVLRTSILFLGLASVFAACQKQGKEPASANPAAASVGPGEQRSALLKKNSSALTGPVTIFASGFNNPRGLKFGPDGNLYVAEGGKGGTHAANPAECGNDTVPFPVGPYKGSPTGSGISVVSPTGAKTTLTDQLPSSSANEIIGGDVEGVADVAFVGNQLYGLLAGAGCSHGVPSVPNGIVKVNADGSWSLVADLSAWLKSHPVAHPEPDDFEPDGTFYSMLNVRGDLYVLEPNHGDFIKVSTSDWSISRVADISATQGHVVPTAMAYHGNFFIGNLHPFPIVDGSSNIYKVNPGGGLKIWTPGVTTVLGLLIDNRDRMYVLENTVDVPAAPGVPVFPTPGFGKIIRIDPSGARTVIASGLNLPTGMTMGPDGNLYVSNIGFGPEAIGGGQVLKVKLN
ncbi:MAG: ScyD/ScyE family protein [Flavisolibacter sp.]